MSNKIPTPTLPTPCVFLGWRHLPDPGASLVSIPSSPGPSPGLMHSVRPAPGKSWQLPVCRAMIWAGNGLRYFKNFIIGPMIFDTHAGSCMEISTDKKYSNYDPY